MILWVMPMSFNVGQRIQSSKRISLTKTGAWGEIDVHDEKCSDTNNEDSKLPLLHLDTINFHYYDQKSNCYCAKVWEP